MLFKKSFFIEVQVLILSSDTELSSNIFLNLNILPPLFASQGGHIAVGQPRGAAAGLPTRSPQGKRAAGAGEAANSGPAERRTGQLPQTAVAAPTGAAALGEGAGEAPAAGGGRRGSPAAEGGGVQAAGGDGTSCTKSASRNREKPRPVVLNWWTIRTCSFLIS